MNQKENCKIAQVEVSDSAVMSLTPVVSVNMITYNHGPYLAEAIEGVIAQKTDFPFELIIGEDCSTDNTREIALDYQRRYPHLIRLIYSNHNVGMHENERRVLEACRGEFVAFCEGDDYWIDPDKLRQQVDVLSKSKCIDITFHNCYLKYEKQGKKILSAVRSPIDKVFTLSEVIAGRGDFMPTASIMVRRSLLISIQPWFDATMPPVGDYFIQVFGSRKGGAHYVSKPMSVYRTEVGVSFTEATKQINTLVEFEKKFLFSLRKLEEVIPGQEEAFKRHIVSHYSGRFLGANSDNFIQIKQMLLSVLKDIYQSKPVAGYGIGADLSEWELFLKLAGDNGKAKDLEEYKCGISRQFLRVAKSIFDYGVLTLRMINTHRSDASDFERAVANWRMEEQGSFLIARSKRFYRLLIKNTG